MCRGTGLCWVTCFYIFKKKFRLTGFDLDEERIKDLNKLKIFKNANLFINASLFEGLPNALVQAINYNVFPIYSDAP